MPVDDQIASAQQSMHAAAQHPEKQVRTRQSDEGATILPGMQHFVTLLRKAKQPELVLLLIERFTKTALPELAALTDAAKCILPVTQSDVPKSYGTRHRAAIGMSEISDAIILVVSEETGGISIAHGGTIHRDIAPDQLANLLQRHFGANRQKDRHATMGS